MLCCAVSFKSDKRCAVRLIFVTWIRTLDNSTGNEFVGVVGVERNVPFHRCQCSGIVCSGRSSFRAAGAKIMRMVIRVVPRRAHEVR